MANEEMYEEEIETLADDESEESLDLHQDPDGGLEQPEEFAQAHWQDEDEQPVDDSHAYAPQPLRAQPLDPLDQLPMALTLRCGTLELTLGDLRRVAAGTILHVGGITPGHATLCHGERVVAEGELVDIDGRLGLQITRMALPA